MNDVQYLQEDATAVLMMIGGLSGVSLSMFLYTYGYYFLDWSNFLPEYLPIFAVGIGMTTMCIAYRLHGWWKSLTQLRIIYGVSGTLNDN